jgi:hypothetical protein
MPVLMLHDGLHTTPAYFHDLLQITREEFGRFGFPPARKKEDHSKDSFMNSEISPTASHTEPRTTTSAEIRSTDIREGVASAAVAEVTRRAPDCADVHKTPFFGLGSDMVCASFEWGEAAACGPGAAVFISRARWSMTSRPGAGKHNV